MELLQSLILGIVQGLTEFLPISSSGHLFLIPEILGWQGVVHTLAFDVALHLGTTVAIILFFWKDWLVITSAFLKSLRGGVKEVWANTDARFFVLIVIGSFPAALIGFLFEDFFETEARNLPLVAIMLIFFGVLLFAADRLSSKTKELKAVTLADTLFIGLAQSLALIPGVSRSGITITSGLFRNLNRDAAARFSFLLSTPITVGALLVKSKDIFSSTFSGSDQGVFIVGTLAAGISGFLAIKILLKLIQGSTFDIFVIYRIVLGVGILMMVIGI